MSNSHKKMIESVTADFASTFDDSSNITVAMAPGRVNLIGEYTDLNDGFVFPMTVDRGVYLAIRKRPDTRVRVASVRYEETIERELNAYEAVPPGSWASYVFGVVEELRQRGLLECGFEAVVDGNLNLGAGLSSSAALEVATAVALQEVMNFQMSRVELVKMCQYVEHNYANVLCGIMDQFACGIGKQDHALMLDCRSLDYSDVPVQLGDYRVVIISSEVKRALSSSAYNERRAECQEAVDYFQSVDASIQALRDVSLELFETHADKLSPVVRRRCGHVVAENQRVLDAAGSLAASDLDQFGELMLASHTSLRDDFEVSCPELDMLVEIAAGTDGVLGSRMTGAGFGGCIVSLVHKESMGLLTSRLAAYEEAFDLTPGIFALEKNLEAGPVI